MANTINKDIKKRYYSLGTGVKNKFNSMLFKLKTMFNYSSATLNFDQ